MVHPDPMRDLLRRPLRLQPRDHVVPQWPGLASFESRRWVVRAWYLGPLVGRARTITASGVALPLRSRAHRGPVPSKMLGDPVMAGPPPASTRSSPARPRSIGGRHNRPGRLGKVQVSCRHDRSATLPTAPDTPTRVRGDTGSTSRPFTTAQNLSRTSPEPTLHAASQHLRSRGVALGAGDRPGRPEESAPITLVVRRRRAVRPSKAMSQHTPDTTLALFW